MDPATVGANTPGWSDLSDDQLITIAADLAADEDPLPLDLTVELLVRGLDPSPYN